MLKKKREGREGEGGREKAKEKYPTRKKLSTCHIDVLN